MQAPFRQLMEPLLVLFNKAAGLVMKDKPFYVAYSIPGGVYGFFKEHEVSDAELSQIALHIRYMLHGDERLENRLMSATEVMNYFRKTARKDIVDLLRSCEGQPHPAELRFAHVGGYGELLLQHVNSHHEKLKHFRLERFGRGFFLIADPVFFERVMPARPEHSKYFYGFEETEETMKHLGIASFAELNNVIRQGRIAEFIKLSEAWQARRISRITDEILERPRGERLIFLAGPTSSGKTTLAHRLAIELKVLKQEVLILSLDNFYLPHSAIPDDPVTGIKNFELITALDLDLFRTSIHELLAGKPVHLPKYHFDGKGAIPEGSPTCISPETFVIVEGIHGLNPGLWKDAVEVDSYRLYVSALSTLNIHDHLPLSTSDLRLIRRMVRDHLFRGYGFNETIVRWPDVMKNEYQSIFPFQESAHAIFNSALVYEPAVFAHYAPGILQIDEAENQQIREEVKRVHRILSLLTPIRPMDIPPTSILREFIGGGSFNYV